MRVLYVLAGLLSLPLFVACVISLRYADGVDFAAHGAITLLSGVLAASIGGRMLRHRGVPPALAQAFFRDPSGWKIVPVGDPESAARFEVVRSR